MKQGFGNDAVGQEDIDDDPELILNSTIRYAKPLISPELLPGEEREMAVDEEEDEEEERNSLGSDGESPTLSLRERSPLREEEVMVNPYQICTQAEIQQQVRVLKKRITLFGAVEEERPKHAFLCSYNHTHTHATFLS